MECDFIKGFFTYALKITTLAKNEHVQFCLNFYLQNWILYTLESQ